MISALLLLSLRSEMIKWSNLPIQDLSCCSVDYPIRPQPYTHHDNISAINILSIIYGLWWICDSLYCVTLSSRVLYCTISSFIPINTKDFFYEYTQFSWKLRCEAIHVWVAHSSDTRIPSYEKKILVKWWLSSIQGLIYFSFLSFYDFENTFTGNRWRYCPTYKLATGTQNGVVVSYFKNPRALTL